MKQFSPELIEKTIDVYNIRMDRELFREEARQAVLNINGFFQVLQEWAEAEDNEGREDEPGCPAKAEGAEQ